jgi:hypothetical protein
MVVNNMSVISWRLDLLVEETGENHRQEQVAFQCDDDDDVRFVLDQHS